MTFGTHRELNGGGILIRKTDIFPSILMSVIFYIKDTGFLGFVFGSILLVYFISRPVEQLLK